MAGVLSPVVVGGGLPLVTTVTDREGNPIATWYEQHRVPVPLGRRRARATSERRRLTIVP
ncbi:hypothetical protein [Saccharothrix deserti]|uniref:hypothetical protein n=1 Tax=Saccharothrix deserti TaxID=2593674 RepID=UPI00131ADA17|nr:hypothetical protein [Saccharothrix deserti]